MAYRDNQPLNYGQQNNPFDPEYNPPPPYTQQHQQYVIGQPLPQITGEGVAVEVFENINTTAFSQTMCSRSRIPILIKCPYCQVQGNSKVKFKMGDGSCFCFILLFIFCCILSFIPCFAPDCQDAEHYCRFCNQLIGVCVYNTCE